MKQVLSLPTILIVIIALAAFFGFGSIFANFDDNIGAQSTSAAFSALFVILSTKVLLNQEQHLQKQSEKEKQDAERKRKVFETRIELYQACAKEIAELLEKDEISLADIHKIRYMALQLQLVAGTQTLEKHSIFATIALVQLQEAIDESRESESSFDEGDSIFQLSDDGRNEIWSAVGELLNACRVDLDMSEDSANKNFSNRFNELLKQFTTADERITTHKKAREPLQGGISEWIKSKFPARFSPECVAQVKKFVNDMEQSDTGLDAKVTKTMISLRKRDAKSHKKVVVYFFQVKKDYYVIGINSLEGDILGQIRVSLQNVGIEVDGHHVMFPSNYSLTQIKVLQAAIKETSALLL